MDDKAPHSVSFILVFLAHSLKITILTYSIAGSIQDISVPNDDSRTPRIVIGTV